MASSCYLCGTTADLTRDHIPPTGFFPDPKPANLITVSCCRRCNSAHSLDDEAFRVWITSPPNVSEAGRWIQQHKVFDGTFKRSPKLVENVRKYVQSTEIHGQKVDLITFPQDRAERFLTRVTKGLLAHFYPEFHRESQSYEITHLTFSTGRREIEILRDQAEYDERGDRVFQFRRRVSLQEQRGYWMYSFYGASLFLVWHRKKEANKAVDPTPVSAPRNSGGSSED